MTKKPGKGLERGLNYIMGIYENEAQKNETKKEIQERLERMTSTADKCVQLIKQCPYCRRWDEEKIRCGFHEKVDYPCTDFICKRDGEEE